MNIEKTYKFSALKIQKANIMLRANGGFVDTEGNFRVKGVAGRYIKTSDDEITIYISQKPFFATESLIIDELNKFFN